PSLPGRTRQQVHPQTLSQPCPHRRVPHVPTARGDVPQGEVGDGEHHGDEVFPHEVDEQLVDVLVTVVRGGDEHGVGPCVQLLIRQRPVSHHLHHRTVGLHIH